LIAISLREFSRGGGGLLKLKRGTDSHILLKKRNTQYTSQSHQLLGEKTNKKNKTKKRGREEDLRRPHRLV